MKEIIRKILGKKLMLVYYGFKFLLSKDIRHYELMINPSFAEDGLITNHTCGFLNDSKFNTIYNQAVSDGLSLGPIKWRTYVGVWAESHCKNLEGDFVECGVAKGFMSKVIMDYINFNETKKTFYLFDTYEGFDSKQFSHNEKKQGIMDSKFEPSYDVVLETFKSFNVKIVKGSIPTHYLNLIPKKFHIWQSI